MLITDGKLLSKAGVHVSMRTVFAETQTGKLVRERESFWTYDPVAKCFAALPIDRVGQEMQAKTIYRVTTKVGDSVLLPEAASVLIEKHGVETTTGVRSMWTFRSWQACKIALAKLIPGNTEPSVIWGEIASIEQQEKPKTEEDELPVFSITGAAGVARLLLVNNFLVGG